MENLCIGRLATLMYISHQKRDLIHYSGIQMYTPQGWDQDLTSPMAIIGHIEPNSYYVFGKKYTEEKISIF